MTCCMWWALDVLHVICTRLRLGHLSVRVGDSSRCSEEIVKNLESRLWMRLLLKNLESRLWMRLLLLLLSLLLLLLLLLLMPGVWPESYSITNLQVTGMTWPGEKPTRKKGFEPKSPIVKADTLLLCHRISKEGGRERERERELSTTMNQNSQNRNVFWVPLITN